VSYQILEYSLVPLMISKYSAIPTHMKMFKPLLAMGIAMFSSIQVWPAIAAPSLPTKSFAQWCEQKAALPVATSRTIEVLLAKAGTKNCQQADSKLKNFTELNLYDSKISDLQPLVNFQKLRLLFLSNNQISDLKPLVNLKSLQELYLANNLVLDMEPLASLSNLDLLDLRNNQIGDVKSLARVTSLRNLDLRNNQIIELQPLSGLNNLSVLLLSKNRINNVKPLANLSELSLLFLQENQINDAQPLSNLKKLTELYLSGNPINDSRLVDMFSSLQVFDLRPPAPTIPDPPTTEPSDPRSH
jgi:internalin A